MKLCKLFVNMRCRATFIAVLSLVVNYSTCVQGEEYVTAKIKQGLVRGVVEKTVSGRKFAAFYNIPFARPPVGEFRFKDPVPAEPWTGELNATGPIVTCAQFDFISLLTLGDEDCLILNVYTPKMPSSSKPQGMEVLVTIHGGGFTFGSSAINSPDYLLDKTDFVFLTMNYRLDVFGFLSTEDTVIQGNYGLKDQSLALKWTRENIAYFGGDPNKVTLGGHSAGGTSTAYHMVAPTSRGLFRSALMWSGTPFSPYAFSPNPRSQAATLATLVSCPPYDHHAMLDCLRRRPAIDLIKASMKFRTYENQFPLSPFSPSIEKASSNYFMNDSVENILINKQAADLPIYLSWTPDEAYFLAAEFFDNGVIANELDRKWNEIAPQILNYVDVHPETLRNEISLKIRQAYLQDKPVAGNGQRITDMLSDRHFKYPFYKFLKMYTANYESPVHCLKFTFSKTLLKFGQFFTYGFNDETTRAGHADDMLFTMISLRGIPYHLLQPKFKNISETLLHPTIAATKGEPLNWPTVNSDPEGIVYLRIDDPSVGKIVEVDPNMGNHKFWETLPPEIHF